MSPSLGRQPASRVLVGDGNQLDDLVEHIYLDSSKKDPMHGHCEIYLSSSHEDAGLRLISELVCILYRIGEIGVRLSPDVKISYSHVDIASLTSADIKMNSAIRIHPMFFLSLKGNTMQGEEDKMVDAA